MAGIAGEMRYKNCRRCKKPPLFFI